AITEIHYRHTPTICPIYLIAQHFVLSMGPQLNARHDLHMSQSSFPVSMSLLSTFLHKSTRVIELSGCWHPFQNASRAANPKQVAAKPSWGSQIKTKVNLS